MRKLIFFMTCLIIFSMNSYSINWDNSVTKEYLESDLQLFSNSELGLGKNYSLKFHPLMMFVAPTFDLIYSLPEKNLSFYTGINYPTPLLSLLSRKGAGGFISPEFDIPQLISFRAGYEQSYYYNEYLKFYTSVGFEFSPTKLDRRMTIDLPIVLSQQAVFNKMFGINLSVSTQGKLIRKFDYYFKIKADVFPITTDEIDEKYKDYLPSEDLSLFVEINPLIVWNYSETFQLAFGSKTTNGDYFFGRKWHTIPFIDFKKSINFN